MSRVTVAWLNANPDYTCPCGLSVHALKRRRDAIHMADCEFSDPAYLGEPSGNRYVVGMCHHGTDYAVFRATEEEIADPTEETLTLDEAREHARDCAKRERMRWFDFSDVDPSLGRSFDDSDDPRFT